MTKQKIFSEFAVLVKTKPDVSARRSGKFTHLNKTYITVLE